MEMIRGEREWIDLAKAGDADAFCRLYEKYQARLYRYAYYRLGNESDAEDAVSECVLSAWRQIGALREPDAFPAWIFRILSGCCSRLIREQIRRRNQVSLDDSSDAIPAQADSAQVDNAQADHVQADNALILNDALACLCEEDRNIVLLSAVGGLKSREIAELTGLAPGSVRSRLSRSLKKVRGYFA